MGKDLLLKRAGNSVSNFRPELALAARQITQLLELSCAAQFPKQFSLFILPETAQFLAKSLCDPHFKTVQWHFRVSRDKPPQRTPHKNATARIQMVDSGRFSLCSL
jgi:hypothetical protein